jgi:AraC-like DNA-binding protein
MATTKTLIKQNNGQQLRPAELIDNIARAIVSHAPQEGYFSTAVPGLSLYRRDEVSSCYPSSYEPSVHVFAQGQKRITLGETTYLCKRGTFLLSSVDLPAVSQVVEASQTKPVLSVVLKLDMAMVREILAQGEFHDRKESARDGAMALGEATDELLRPCLRMLQLLDAPDDVPFLTDLIQREVVYRLLRGPKGERLRSIATLGGQSHNTAKAIAWLRANYKKRLHLEELANVARMGMSTLHHHFRELTSMSPLQYQKQLRLVAARERMLSEGVDAATAAFDVGYESASQFSREYKRFFGQPPIQDVKASRVGRPAIH